MGFYMILQDKYEQLLESKSTTGWFTFDGSDARHGWSWLLGARSTVREEELIPMLLARYRLHPTALSDEGETRHLQY